MGYSNIGNDPNYKFLTNSAGKVIDIVNPKGVKSGIVTSNTDASGNQQPVINGIQITGFSTLRDKIRSALSKQLSKPHLSTFMQVPPAWAATTAYKAGQAIAAGGNWYCALVDGTSGASAPTWTTTPQTVSPFSSITDGTVQWVYYSPALTLYPSDTTVAVSLSASHNSSATNIYTPVTGSWGAPTSFIPDTNTNQDNQFIPQGGATTAVIASWVGDLLISPNALTVSPIQSAGGALGLNSSWGNKDATFQIGNGYWEINTDAQIIEFATSRYDTSRVIVKIDDVTVTLNALANTLGTGNANTYTQILITGAIRKRNIKLFGLNNIRQVAINGNAQLFKVQRPVLDVLACGDSFFAGSGMSGAFSAFWPDFFARELGTTACCNFSVGGTGVEVNSSGYNWVQRVNETGGRSFAAPYNYQALGRKQWDIIFVEMGNGNDNPLSTTLPAKLLGILQTFRLLQPNALIVGVSVYGGTNETYYQNMNNMAKAVWAQFNDPKSVFVYTAGEDGQRWVTGNNRNASGQVAATGNSSLMIGSDGTHGMDNTNIFLGQKSAQGLLDALQISTIN